MNGQRHVIATFRLQNKWWVFTDSRLIAVNDQRPACVLVIFKRSWKLEAPEGYVCWCWKELTAGWLQEWIYCVAAYGLQNQRRWCAITERNTYEYWFAALVLSNKSALQTSWDNVVIALQGCMVNGYEFASDFCSDNITCDSWFAAILCCSSLPQCATSMSPIQNSLWMPMINQNVKWRRIW